MTILWCASFHKLLDNWYNTEWNIASLFGYLSSSVTLLRAEGVLYVVGSIAVLGLDTKSNFNVVNSDELLSQIKTVRFHWRKEMVAL